MLKPVRVTVSASALLARASAHPMFEPLHAPLLTSITTSKADVGVTETICDVSVAVNLYHTSSAAPEVEDAHVMDGMDCVEFKRLPAVTAVQELPLFTVNIVALEHSSFATAAAVVKLQVLHPVAEPPAFRGTIIHE